MHLMLLRAKGRHVGTPRGMFMSSRLGCLYSIIVLQSWQLQIRQNTVHVVYMFEFEADRNAKETNRNLTKLYDYGIEASKSMSMYWWQSRTC